MANKAKNAKEKEILQVVHPADAPPPKLKYIGGSDSDAWNNHLASSVLNSLVIAQTPFAQDRQEGQAATIAGIASVEISDPIEAIIVGQIIAANDTSLEMRRRAWLKDQSFECRVKYLALADKAARTIGTLSEALDRRRGKGQQIVVKHVTVNADQAVVTDHVITGTRGLPNGNRNQPHAKAISNASDLEMPCDVETDGQKVPIASS